MTEDITKEEMEKALDEIAEVVGSLRIDQFKGDDKQDRYQAVINDIFKQYKDRDGETSEQENRK